MSEAQEPIAYREQIEFLRDSIQALAVEAMAVFREDVPHFFHREARNRFLAASDFARGLDDKALKALKAEIDEAGRAASARLMEELKDRELWLSGTTAESPSGKRFEDNPTLWAVVGAVCEELAGLLERHGFPKSADGGYDLAYHEPKRFVSGHYLPSIAEKYWRRIAELAEVEGMLEELEGERERSELLTRWNKF